MFIFLMSILSCLIHAHEHTTRTRSIVQLVTDKLNLLGYRHLKTVLFLFLNPILRWNPFGCSRLLPQLKVPDFPDTEHE